MRKYKKHVEETYRAIREENKEFLTEELRETIEHNKKDKSRSRAFVRDNRVVLCFDCAVYGKFSALSVGKICK